MTTLAELQKVGGFVGDKPVKTPIKFEIDGTEYDATIYIKRISIAYFDILRAGEGMASNTYKILTDMVGFGKDGEERLTLEQAKTLNVNLATAIINAFIEVNSNGKKG